MKHCILLLSGGFDSTIVTHLLLSQDYSVQPLFVDYNQAAKVEEQNAAEYFTNYFQLAPLLVENTSLWRSSNHALLHQASLLSSPTAFVNQDPYLPYRNLHLLTIASVIATSLRITNLAIGFNLTTNYNQFPDASPSFAQQFERLIAPLSGSHPISILTPAEDLTKTELLRYAVVNNIPIQYSYSCYQSAPRCGACISCKAVQGAFDQLSEDYSDLDSYNPYTSLSFP